MRLIFIVSNSVPQAYGRHQKSTRALQLVYCRFKALENIQVGENMIMLHTRSVLNQTIMLKSLYLRLNGTAHSSHRLSYSRSALVMVAFVEILKKQSLHTPSRLPLVSLPAQGWVCIEIHNIVLTLTFRSRIGSLWRPRSWARLATGCSLASPVDLQLDLHLIEAAIVSCCVSLFERPRDKSSSACAGAKYVRA